LDWSTAIWERDSNIQSSLEEFKNRLCEVFDHPHEAKEAEEQLRALCQEHQTAADCALTSEPLRVRVELACRDDNFTLEKYSIYSSPFVLTIFQICIHKPMEGSSFQ